MNVCLAKYTQQAENANKTRIKRTKSLQSAAKSIITFSSYITTDADIKFRRTKAYSWMVESNYWCPMTACVCILYRASSSLHQAAVQPSSLSTVLELVADQIVGQTTCWARWMECKPNHNICKMFQSTLHWVPTEMLLKFKSTVKTTKKHLFASFCVDWGIAHRNRPSVYTLSHGQTVCYIRKIHVQFHVIRNGGGGWGWN